MAVVHIESPCPLKLNQLDPVEGGFHCSQCNKVVLDFRDKSDDNILSVLKKAEEQRVCGLYNSNQVLKSFKPGFQILRFAASLLLVFGVTLFASCGNDVREYKIGDSTKMGDSVATIEGYAKLKADSMRIADSLASADSMK